MKNSARNWISNFCLPLLLPLLLLSGCSSSSNNAALKPDVPIFTKTPSPNNTNHTDLTPIKKQPLNEGFVRTQNTELQNRFPQIPNRALNLFVYPHLSTDGHPIPGYSTVFRLYKQDHYALPNEIY